MTKTIQVQLLLVFAIILSLASLPGPLSSVLHYPSIPRAQASPAPGTLWLPAGPSINTETQQIFSNSADEQTALLAGSIDLTDTALTPEMIACLSQTGTSCTQFTGVNPSQYYVTSPTTSGQQYGYLNTWQQAINNVNRGLPNSFTWLNTHNTNYSTTTTVTQGFSAPTQSLNPYTASTASDFQTIRQIYDSLGLLNPTNNAQSLEWMTNGHSTLCDALSGTPCTPSNLNLNNVFAQNPTTSPGASTWNNTQNGFVPDTLYATSDSYGQTAQYGNYGINLANDAQIVITNVEIGLYAHQSPGGADQVLVEYSIDGGAKWNTAFTPFPSNFPTLDSQQFASVLSQQTWTTTLLSNSNLQVRITHTHPSGPHTAVTVSVNWVPVRITFLTNPIPPGTNAAVHFQLRTDNSWQSDTTSITHPSRPVTSWDVRFSYLTLKAAGAFQATSLTSLVDPHVVWKVIETDGTLSILGDNAGIDLYLTSLTPTTIASITSPTVIPGRYWSATCSGTIWDADIASATVPDGCMTVSNAMSTITFDPISSTPNNGQSTGILIGSGPFECQSTSGIVGSGCSSSGAQNPQGGGSYTLTRYGCSRATGTCNAPGANPTTTYFRSAGTLALYIWTGNNGDSIHDSVNVSGAAFCFQKPVGSPDCTRWQRGLGNPGSGKPVDIGQVSSVIRFTQDGNWIPPFNWLPGMPLSCCPFVSNPPDQIQTATPTLIEGTIKLDPCNVDAVNGYDC